MARPVFTAEECRKLAIFLDLGGSPSEEEIAHSWAENYWHNHATGFANGTPADGVSVQSEKLIAVAKHFERDMCTS